MDNKAIDFAIKAIKHQIPTTYDQSQNSDVLRNMFIEANGGSTKIGLKTFRDHPELYQIIETLLPVMIEEGLKGDEFFMNFVEYRNLALGDELEFNIEDRSVFAVSSVASGTQAIRRQRLDGGSKITVVPTLKAIKIYDELNRLLAGRVDFNYFVNKIQTAFNNEVFNEIYTIFNGITSSTTGMSSDAYKSGSYSESTLLGLVDFVETRTNSNATIVGTRTALRNVTQAVVSDRAKEDFYGAGYYGKFNGTPMVRVKQRLNINSNSYILDDTKLYVIATNDRFIKYVNGGEGLLVDGNPTDRPDFTKEYLYGQSGSGVALIGTTLGINDLA